MSSSAWPRKSGLVVWIQVVRTPSGGEDGEDGEYGEDGEDGEYGEYGEDGEYGECGEDGEYGEYGEDGEYVPKRIKGHVRERMDLDQFCHN
jgi:hypothetical protein